MGPVRVEGWPGILAAEIEAARARPFMWGEHDCASWTFAVAARLQGQPDPDWIGTYDSQFSALRRLREATHVQALSGMGDAILGQALGTPLLAQRGDVVFSRGAFGICIGRDSVHVGEAGLVAVPMTEAERAWRV